MTVALHRTLLADAVARITLRPYQAKGREKIEHEWTMGRDNVLGVYPTGAGKTSLFSAIMADNEGASCAIAHRKELVVQMSLALAKNRVYHRIIGDSKLVKIVSRLHMEKVGASYYSPSARVAVASVQTIVNRGKELASWLPTVTLWVTDEAHHLTRENVWGIAVEMFPRAKGLGVTATPCRADGKGLGRHADGVFDAMVIGPSMRELIDMGFLTDYIIYSPPSSIDRSKLDVSKSTGDFNKDQVAKIVASSSLVVHDDKHVTGDIVDHYLRLAKGKQGVTFVPSIEVATEVARQFNDAGIPAAAVSSKTETNDRDNIMRRFERRELLQLVNVDLLGEGVDIPAIEVVSMGRPTESFGLWVQQAGRALRLADGKTRAIIIDHVGNAARHGTVVDYGGRNIKMEICHREWTLDRRERRSAGKSEPVTTRSCLTCTGTFARTLDACPYCGEPIPEPANRTTIEFVDGDLTALDSEALAALMGQLAHVDRDPGEYRNQLVAQGCPQLGVLGNVKRLVATQEVVAQLREAEAVWAGYERAAGLSDREIMRKFFSVFGVDLWTAQTWKAADMTALIERINGSIRT